MVDKIEIENKMTEQNHRCMKSNENLILRHNVTIRKNLKGLWEIQYIYDSDYPLEKGDYFHLTDIRYCPSCGVKLVE